MAAQNIVSPITTALYAVPLPTKRRAVIITQSQTATVNLQLLDNSGNPVDLTEQGPQDELSVEAHIREVIKTKSGDIFEVTCTVVDVATGEISFDVPSQVAKNSGVYTVEIAVFSGEDLIFSNKLFLWVDRGLFGDPRYPNAGPPTLDEIRLFIRDNAPEENRLLDDFEFDLAEVCYSAELGVRHWNEAQPAVGVIFNTTNYCVRNKWLEFIAGQMFLTAAHRFRRNHLPYQASGVSVDDQNKFQLYDQIGMALVQDYREWVKQKKVQINCFMAMTASGSPYGTNTYNVMNTGM